MIQVIPDGAPDSEQTEDLVQTLRAQGPSYSRSTPWTCP